MMKRISTLMALASILVFTSCVKEPTACITGPTALDIYESGTFTSCSEDEETLEWSVPTIGLFGTIQTKSAANFVTNDWASPGTYTIELQAISKNDKKRDVAAHTVTVSDICYTCIYTYFDGSTATDNICASSSFVYSADEFEQYIDDLEAGGSYSCTRQ